MAPILAEGFTSPDLPLLAPPCSRKLSSSSAQSLVDLLGTSSTSRLTPTVVVSEDGLRHAKIRLDARHYKKPSFVSQLLEILRSLYVHGWCTAKISPGQVDIHRVSGALTNAVFFVSCHSLPTLLLRVYGPSSGSLISRTRELHTLHMLSSRYQIGPQVYGTFENGRIEEYFDAVTLTSSDIRDPQISQWIAARMAEFHFVNIADVYDTADDLEEDARRFGIAEDVKAWLGPAGEVLKLHNFPESFRNEFDLPRFKEEWQRYLAWAIERKHTVGTRRVFAHNDAQYGNLLRLKNGSESVDEHQQIIVVDFEYAAPNPAAYDIANHFHEWTANYHGPTPHVLTPSRYPSPIERRNFYASYLRHAAMLAEDPFVNETTLTNLLEELDSDVEIWGAASHAGWAIWGIVQARETVEGNVDGPEFDYIGYASGRMAAFRKALQAFGIAL